MTTAIAHVAADRECDHYLRLVREFPLRPLRTNDELACAIAVIDSLIVRGDLDGGERDYLDILADIVEKYEDKVYPMPAVSDAEMLRHLIEARDVTQTRLAADLEIADSTISEYLAGKRTPNRRHIGLFCRYFSIEPTVFLF